ncbi:MAG: hypothetical protein JSW66_06390 [Phycisphaerales bacterium]|nr:MAG: hypothetical protein JSW66_06390 [Phycisphaerales bacterium]
MMKLSPAKCVLPYLWLFVVICSLCAAPSISPGATAAPTEPSSTEEAAAGPSTVVGRIGTYVITKKELEDRLMTELHPYDQEFYGQNARPPDAMTVLMKMVAEKAMIMEARKQTYLQDEMISASIKRYRDRRLVNLLVQKYVEKNRGKTAATEDEIKQKMQADPKLDKDRAKAEIERARAGRLLDEYYKQIYTKSRAKKLNQYFPRAVEVHQRLLHRPKAPRKVPWMQTSQVRDELAPSEANMVLALYSGGKITLKDWLTAYCDIVPPRRPKIDTPAAVDELLERAMSMPLLVWEAKSLGLDKDQDFVKQVREYEDRRLLGEVQLARQKELTEPMPEELTAYFNENKEAFGTSEKLKIDLIWCEDLPTARKVKAELESGRDFEAVREQYSLEKKGKAFQTQPGSEGLFWKDLWAGEPGRILGPLKGFYGRGMKWRIVKILEKTPGQPKEYSSQMDSQIKDRMMTERRKQAIAMYGQELLRKYPFQVYPDRVKEIDPLEIP